MPVAPPPGPHLQSSSTITPDYGIEIDQTDDGSTKTRQLYSVTYYTINARWFCDTDADADLLLQWLRINTGGTVSITLRGHTYTCKVLPQTERAWPQSSNTSMVSAVLRGTRDGE